MLFFVDVIQLNLLKLIVLIILVAKQGVVGVASAGPDFYVIALANPSVQHGALGKHSFY